jgi:hypothetical protein
VIVSTSLARLSRPFQLKGSYDELMTTFVKVNLLVVSTALSLKIDLQ